MSTMVFITHYLRNQRHKWLVWLVGAALLGFASTSVRADSGLADAPVLSLERHDDAIWMSTQLRFELASTVEDALLKGIPVFFVAEVDVLRERWYWSSKKIATAQRHIRLAYQPLTRRWRVNRASGEITESALGLSLNQYFDSLHEALSAIQRISRWKLADSTEIDASARHFVEFRFRLDLTQLPRPLQIGTLGQSEWTISLSAMQSLSER